MRAVILAAGLGSRLGALGAQQAKCLLAFDGRSLLRRHLEALAGLGVRQLALVVGHQAAEVEAEVARASADVVTEIVHNPRFEQGSAVSLWCAREALRAGDDVLLMDADVLYHPSVLRKLARSPGNLFLLDRNLDGRDDEAVKLCLRGGRVVEFRKQVDPDLAFDEVGESVGFFRFDAAWAARLAQRADAWVQAGRVKEPYEEIIRELVLETPAAFGWAEVTGLPWIEIDFPEDVERARRDVLPRLGER